MKAITRDKMLSLSGSTMGDRDLFSTCRISIMMALTTVLILIVMTQFLKLDELHLENVLTVSK